MILQEISELFHTFRADKSFVKLTRNDGRF